MTPSTQGPCRKAIHNPAESGYLHGPDDDTRYHVDGVAYCGRCHRALPEHEYGDEGGPSTEAKIKHTALDLDEFQAMQGAAEVFLMECHDALAELRRNRRLLEAGERLAAAVTTFNDPIVAVREALAAYQEAAK